MKETDTVYRLVMRGVSLRPGVDRRETSASSQLESRPSGRGHDRRHLVWPAASRTPVWTSNCALLPRYCLCLTSTEDRT